ncbi:MAG: VWA domain-containing protein [Planctomycetota bacterium]|nr:VWA domain-containing protein [Planctomycetota bacterium]
MLVRVLIALCALCGGLFAGEDRPLLLIVDQSASMRSNDPRRFAVDAVQLAIAILRHHKQFAIVGFAHRVNELVPWSAISDNAQRAQLRDGLDRRLTFDGRSTLYVQALNRAAELLLTRRAPPGTRIVFFTDGAPDDSAEDIRVATQPFVSNGWVVDTVRLKAKDDPIGPELASISEATRGRHAEISDAAALIERFIDLAAADNDAFILDGAQRDWTAVTVPLGASQLLYVVARNEARRQRGSLTALYRDDQALDLAEQRVYRYPLPGSRQAEQANVEALLLDRPEAGVYRPAFDGVPTRVFVSLSFAWRVNTLPIPAIVDEGQTVRLGVQVAAGSPEEAERLVRSLNTHVKVDMSDGSSLLAAPAVARAVDSQVVCELPWRVRLPDAIDRSRSHPLQVSYRLAIGQWVLHKYDAFSVRPAAQPLRATAAWNPASLTLAAWVGGSAEGQLRLAADSPREGRWLLAADRGFSFAPASVAVPGEHTLTVRFAPTSPGAHAPTITLQGAPDGVATPSLIGHAYPWQGRDSLVLVPGPTGIPDWSPGAPGLPPQPFAGGDAILRSDSGVQLIARVASDGTATILSDAVTPAGTYSGVMHLRFGTLPPRPLQLTYVHQAATPTFAWSEPAVPSGREAWLPGRWTPIVQEAAFQAGPPGRISVALSDFVGPEDERLTVAYDLRATVQPERILPGQRLHLELAVYRGRKALPGTYRGSYTVTFTGDNGVQESWTVPMTIELP